MTVFCILLTLDRSLSPAVPTATILGGPDLYVDKGSTINLTCAIRFSPEPPPYIFWYHLDEVGNCFLISMEIVLPWPSSRSGTPSLARKCFIMYL